MAAKKTLAAKPARKGAVKQSPAKRTTARKSGDGQVTLDRRRGARREESETVAVPAVPLIERRQKVQRRRQIDPTTCERDYSIEEVEFMNAMDDYKRKSGRMFPTCSEVLEVIRDLGYVRLSPAGRVMMAEVETPTSEATEPELSLSEAF